jgi:hypothetical protein
VFILYQRNDHVRGLELTGIDTSDLARDDEITLSSAVKIIGLDEDDYVIQPVKLATPPQAPTDAGLLASKKGAVDVKRAAIERERAKEEREKAIEAAKWRIWTDASGEHKIEAKFSGMLSGTVKLTKRDGSTLKVPLEKLSDEDKAWIENRSK